MADDYVSDLRAFCAEWLKQNRGYDLIDHGFGAEHGGELTTVKLGAVLDELERLRAQVVDHPEQLADAQEMALDKLVEAFGEGWDNCRIYLEDEARLKRGIAVTQYSNQLPWPTYVAPQQPDLDALCVRDAMADAAMRQPESGAAK